MTWTILLVKKPNNGWFINYIENKLNNQIIKYNLQNFIEVIVFEPNINFYSDFVSVIDDEIEISDNFISVVYDKISNTTSDCIGLKGVININGSPYYFNNISKNDTEIYLPTTKLNPIKTEIIFKKISNIVYYLNSEVLLNLANTIDQVDTSIIFLEKTINMPISIIVTAYQTHNYIEECLDSIEKQTYFINNDNFEVLVGVDACQDTFDKLEEIKHKYRNLKIYMMSENKGTYITTNTLIDLVKNDNVIRFDSDDIMTPNLVKEVFNNKKDNDIIMLGYVDIKDGELDSKLCVAGGIIYFRKSVMDNIAGGYMPWKCAADSELMMRLMNKVKIMQLKKILFYRRIHDNSLTKRIETGHNSDIRNKYTKQIKSHYKDSEVKIERVVNSIKNKYNLVFMITTYNRINFLKETIETWQNTINKKYKWTLIVADDGSTDGTLEYLYNLEIENIKIIIIENNRRGVHHQTNSLIKYVLDLDFDYGFKSDDDLIFKNKGWDDTYLNSSIKTNFYHLIFYDKNWGGIRNELKESIFKDSILENCTNYKDLQGAFWTFDRNVLEKVGFFDTDKYNFCGLGHVDFSLRCCRLGYNDIESPYDIINSNHYISLNTEDYVSNNEYNNWNTEEIIKNKIEILDEYRTYIDYNEIPMDINGNQIDIERISFCIPAYKSQKFIEECLDSIERQLCEKEILVGVDSCLETLNKLKQISLKYKNLRIFWFPENVGTSIVKNTLSTYAKYNIISFFDSDDIMNTNYSKHVLKNINNNNILRFRFEDFDDKECIKRNYCANGVMSIYKDNFLKLNGFWSYRITEDYDFIERWKKIGEDVQLNVFGFKRRLHENNISFDLKNGCYGDYGKKLLEISKNRVNDNNIINDKLVIGNCEEIFTSLNNYFDKIYCLNLDRRPDKWQNVQKRFNKLNLNVQRFSAIDGNNISDKELSKYNKINKFEVGCILSHYNIIKDAKLNNYKRILVFEDDVIFSKNFNSLFKNKISKLNNWKIFYLGASQYQWSDIEFTTDFYYSNNTDGTFAFAIDESMYDEILNTENITDKPIDYKLWDIQKKYYKQCYTSFPNLVISDVSDSDIRDQRENSEHKIKMKWNLYEYE